MEEKNISRSSIFRNKMKIEREKNKTNMQMGNLPCGFTAIHKNELREDKPSIVSEDIGKEPGE